MTCEAPGGRHNAHADECDFLEDLAIRSIGLASHVLGFLGDIEGIGIEGASHAFLFAKYLQNIQP